MGTAIVPGTSYLHFYFLLILGELYLELMLGRRWGRVWWAWFCLCDQGELDTWGESLECRFSPAEELVVEEPPVSLTAPVALQHCWLPIPHRPAWAQWYFNPPVVSLTGCARYLGVGSELTYEFSQRNGI